MLKRWTLSGPEGEGPSSGSENRRAWTLRGTSSTPHSGCSRRKALAAGSKAPPLALSSNSRSGGDHCQWRPPSSQSRGPAAESAEGPTSPPAFYSPTIRARRRRTASGSCVRPPTASKSPGQTLHFAAPATSSAVGSMAFRNCALRT